MMKKKNEMTPVGQTNYCDQTDNIQTNKQTNHHRKEWWAKPDSGKCQFALRTWEKGGKVLKPDSWFFLWAIIIQPMYCEMWKENLWFSSLILYLSAAKNHRTSVRGRWRLLSSSKEPLIVISKHKTFYICTKNYYEADHHCPDAHIT